MEPAKIEAIVPTRPDWLRLRAEEPLRPELAVVDPHHHLWDRGGAPYHLAEFGEDIAGETGGHRLLATVFMECDTHYLPDGPEHLRPVGEVSFAAELGEANDREGGPRICAGIVGHADLRLGEGLQDVIDTMREAGRGRFRGFRQIAAWHPDPRVKGTVANPPPHLLMDEAFRRGLKRLGAGGLTFDTWALHTQLGELHDAARTAPDVTIVMDHAGGAIGMGPFADRRDAAFSEWRTAVRYLANAPNVHAKIGGFGMRLWNFAFHDRPLPPSSDDLAAAIRPYVETLIEAFGPRRCMFESNFPVDKGSFAYVVLWNAFKRLVEGYSAEEQSALLRGTAEAVYSLDVRA